MSKPASCPAPIPIDEQPLATGESKRCGWCQRTTDFVFGHCGFCGLNADCLNRDDVKAEAKKQRAREKVRAQQRSEQ
jgi:hypothetical protein